MKWITLTAIGEGVEPDRELLVNSDNIRFVADPVKVRRTSAAIFTKVTFVDGAVISVRESLALIKARIEGTEEISYDDEK
jgi:hypothetical protein